MTSTVTTRASSVHAGPCVPSAAPMPSWRLGARKPARSHPITAATTPSARCSSSKAAETWRGVQPTAPRRPISRRRSTSRATIEPATTTAAATRTNNPNAVTNAPNTRSSVRKSLRVSSHESVPPMPRTPASAWRCTNGSASFASSKRSHTWLYVPSPGREPVEAAGRHPCPAGVALGVEAVGQADGCPDDRERRRAAGRQLHLIADGDAEVGGEASVEHDLVRAVEPTAGALRPADRHRRRGRRAQ